MTNNIQAVLPEIILRVKQKEELTREEHLIYLIHIKGLTQQEAIKLIGIKNPEVPQNNLQN